MNFELVKVALRCCTVAAPLLHERLGYSQYPQLFCAFFPANRRFLGVGDAGFEPASSAV